MIPELNSEQIFYIESHQEEAVALLKQLGKLPAPSLHEDKRAQFCKGWLEQQGGKNVRIDSAKNVIYYAGPENREQLTVFMAHMDVVFPDTEDFCIQEKDGCLFCPGIGDDTANLVNLLMAAKYVIESAEPPNHGILFAANSGEEGLGNLKGCRQIFQDYKGRIKQLISFDLYTGMCTNQAVGCHRYRITLRTEGGHSYRDFGKPNAIILLSSMIQTLCAIPISFHSKTTYNFGQIQGGTSINSIPQEASVLYEYRSIDRECLKQMEEFFNSVVLAYQKMGISVQVAVLDQRPCNGNINPIALQTLTEQTVQIIRSYYSGEIQITANSTDANIPLSLGIPANTIGTVLGGNLHTREEWIDPSSLSTGMKISLACVLNIH